MCSSDLLVPDAVTYNTIIYGCVANKDLERAFELLNEMRTVYHLVPDAVTYNSLILGSLVNNDVDRAFQLLQEMQTAGLSFDVDTFNLIIQAHGKLGDYTGAYDAFLALESSGLKPNLVTYANAIRAAPSLMVAKLLWQQLRDIRSPGVQHYEAMVAACCRLSSDPSDALKIASKYLHSRAAWRAEIFQPLWQNHPNEFAQLQLEFPEFDWRSCNTTLSAGASSDSMTQSTSTRLHEQGFPVQSRS